MMIEVINVTLRGSMTMDRLCLLCFTLIGVHGTTEISSDGGLWHYTPVSQWSHWVFPSDVSMEVFVGTGSVVFQRGQDGSLSITWDPQSVPIDALDIAALVRCELGRDARLQELAFDGRCEVINPPGCVRFVPKFRRITLCIKTGEFVGDFLLTDIGDAGDLERINGYVPFNVTVGC